MLALVGAFEVGASCLVEASYLDGKSSLCAVVKDYCKSRKGKGMRKCVSAIKCIRWLCNPYCIIFRLSLLNAAWVGRVSWHSIKEHFNQILKVRH